MDSKQLDKLRELVKRQYQQEDNGRDEWADWLYNNHVLWVANKTDEYCERFGANKNIAVAGALVHDIADSVMRRENDGHETKSLEIGRELCKQAGYSDDEISIIIDDIALKHSCHDGIVPESEEGKLMAAADAASHYMTDFFFYAFNHGSGFGDYDWITEWARKKVKRDINEKVFHEEIRQEILPHYKSWVKVLS